MIPRELEVEILRLRHAEKWPVGTIGAQLDVHHEVVERVVAQDSAPSSPALRPRMVDPYVGFVRETWEKYPKLPATRLWAMCRERGYPGGKDHFGEMVRPHRPVPKEAFLRLTVLPGEQGQFDWAHFGHVDLGRARRPLLAFVGVLSWSRAIFMRFYLGQQVENVLRGQEEAYTTWGGVARVALYDNMKTVVVQRVGQAIRFNERLLDFAAHYRYEARPVAKGRGNEKGRVERAIRYARYSFFLTRRWRDLADLNRQADEWCRGETMERPWPQDPRRTVREVFEEERPKLLPLPANPYSTDERREVAVGKTPYVRFDGNDYSVPHSLVRRPLIVVASLDVVRVLDGNDEVARHARSYDRGAIVEERAHVEALVEAKHAARENRGMTRLSHTAPSTQALLEKLAERGKNLGNATSRLLVLLDLHGAAALEGAVREVLVREVPHVHAVRQVLEREQAVRGMRPVIPIELPDDPRIRDLRVRPHSLDAYGALHSKDDGREESDGEGCTADLFPV